MDNLSEIKGIICKVLSWRAGTLTIHLFYADNTKASYFKVGRFFVPLVHIYFIVTRHTWTIK